MSLFILNKRPVISAAVSSGIVLDYFILCRIIRILADTPCKFGMVGIDTRIYYRHGYTACARIVPDIFQVEIIEICLKIICAVANGILRTHGNAPRIRFLFGKLTDIYAVVRRHGRKLAEIFIRRINIDYRCALWQ